MSDGSASRTLLWSKAALDRVAFYCPKRLGNGGTRVDLEYSLSQPGQAVGLRQKLRLQTPRFKRVMIGESKYKPGKFTAAFACNGHDTRGSEVHGFLTKFVEPFEQRVQKESSDQALSWFKKEMSLDTARTMYTSCVKPPSDASKEKHGNDLAPLLKCNIESSPQRIELDVYKGPARTPSSLAEFRDCDGRKEVVGIIDLESVWFMGLQFGVTPVLRSLWWFPEDRPQGSAAFVDDSSYDGGAGAVHPASPARSPDPEAEGDRDVAMRFLEDQPPAKRQRHAD